MRANEDSGRADGEFLDSVRVASHHLDPEQQPPVGLLQLLLAALQLASVLLLLLQPPDVLHRGLEDGAFVPAHVAAERTNVEGR